MKAKPIEILYNGYRFRSRHEARFAVFFDILRIPYHYEIEGYNLDGMRYIPDFWLPELDCWVEIKGWRTTAEECEKAKRLAQATQKSVFMLWGDLQPFWQEPKQIMTEEEAWRLWEEEGEYHPTWDLVYHGVLGHHFCPKGENKEVAWLDTFWMFTECPECKKIEITYMGLTEDISCGCMSSKNLAKDDERRHGYNSPRLTIAYISARQARFEFGEYGARFIKSGEDIINLEFDQFLQRMHMPNNWEKEEKARKGKKR